MTTLFIPGRGPLWYPPDRSIRGASRRLRQILTDERGAFISDFAAAELADHLLGTSAMTSPTNFGSLHSDHPGETGANELAGGSYARQTIAFDAFAAGVADNTAIETWLGIDGAPNEVGFVGLFDASTVGNFLWYAPLGGAPSTFTAADTGDLFTSFAHGLSNDDRVFLTAWPGSALPAGPAADTVLFISSGTTDTFQVSLTQGGAAIALTSDGEGIAYFVDFRTFNDGDDFNVAAGDLNFELD